MDNFIYIVQMNEKYIKKGKISPLYQFGWIDRIEEWKGKKEIINLIFFKS